MMVAARMVVMRERGGRAYIGGCVRKWWRSQRRERDGNTGSMLDFPALATPSSSSLLVLF